MSQIVSGYANLADQYKWHNNAIYAFTDDVIDNDGTCEEENDNETPENAANGGEVDYSNMPAEVVDVQILDFNELFDRNLLSASYW